MSRVVLYRPLWDFVLGEEVRAHLQDVFAAARDHDRPYMTLMRCDGPDRGLLTRMTVRPREHGLLTVTHTTLRSGGLPSAPVTALADRYCDSRCSHCCALKLGDDWVPSFARPDAVNFPSSFVVCPECQRGASPREHPFMLSGLDARRGA